MYACGPDEGGRPGSRYFKRKNTGQVVSEQELSANN